MSDDSLRLLETALAACTLATLAVLLEWPAPLAAASSALGACLPAFARWLRAQMRTVQPVPEIVQALLDALPCTVYLKDAQSRYTLVNKAFLDDYGLRSEAALGKEPEAIFGPVYGDMVRREDQRVLAGEILDKQETGSNPLIGRGHSQRVVKLRVDLPGRGAMILGCNLNLTPWQQAEASLEAALQHEQLLRRREQDFLKRLLDSSPHPQCLTDAEGTLVQVNSAFAHWQGINAESVIGRKLTELAEEPEQAQRWRQELQAALAGERVEYEFTSHEYGTHALVQRKLRRTRIAAADARPLVISLFTDISQLKDTEQALQDALAREGRRVRSAQEFALHLIDALPFPVYLLDRDAHFLGANAAMARECGCAQEALPGLDLEQLAPASLEPTWRETERALTRAAFDGESTDDEFALTQPFTGRPCLWRVGRFGCEGADGRRLVLGYHLDQSAAQQAEATLRQALADQVRQHSFFRRAIESLPIPVFMENQHGRLLFANAALARLLGLRPEELPGRGSESLGLPAAQPRPEVEPRPAQSAPRSFRLTPGSGAAPRACTVTELWIEAADGSTARLVSLSEAETVQTASSLNASEPPPTSA